MDLAAKSARLQSALRDLGANVGYHIPNRFSEGHGIHVPTLKTLLDGGVDLLLTCDTGVTAHDAVKLAHSRLVDVVITDLGMPYVDGRKVAAAIKAQSPQTPVVLLTGWGRRLIAENETPPHVDRILSKPPTIEDLTRGLRSVTSKVRMPARR